MFLHLARMMCHDDTVKKGEPKNYKKNQIHVDTKKMKLSMKHGIKKSKALIKKSKNRKLSMEAEKMKLSMKHEIKN